MVGDRLAGLERKALDVDEIPNVIRTYLQEFVAKRQQGETFSKYWGRTHQNGPRPVPEQFHLELTERAARLAGSTVTAAG